MALTLQLPPEEEKQFQEWARRQGESVQKDAQQVYAAPRSFWMNIGLLFAKATALVQPALSESQRQNLGWAQYLLLIVQTMTALAHANAGRPYTVAELAERSPLEDAMTLFQLEVVSLEIGARIAGVSQSEFMDALGKAGISVFQYSIEEALAEAEAA